MFYVLDVGNMARFKENKKHKRDCKCCYQTTDLRKTIALLIDRYYDIPHNESMTWELLNNVLTLDGYRTLVTDYEIEIYVSENEMINRLAEIIAKGEK